MQTDKILIIFYTLVFFVLTIISSTVASKQISTPRLKKNYLEETTKCEKKTFSNGKREIINLSNFNFKRNYVPFVKKQCVLNKEYYSSCEKKMHNKPIMLVNTHKFRLQQAQRIALTKLMNQIGKPYRWGGSSPRTGFDCSGLVYYAYKDLLKIRIPRTANEMFHLRNAAPVSRSKLKSGDLVFFQTHSRSTADHVGVYIGNGKFIQSPRSGRNIQITSLRKNYWQRHYIGARRIMTLKTVR